MNTIKNNSSETSAKFKRQSKEQSYQQLNNMIKNISTYEKDWLNTSMTGSAVILNFTSLGGLRGFETLIYGEHFDELVKPSILEALKRTLNDKVKFTELQIKQAKNIIEK